VEIALKAMRAVTACRCADIPPMAVAPSRLQRRGSASRSGCGGVCRHYKCNLEAGKERLAALTAAAPALVVNPPPASLLAAASLVPAFVGRRSGE